MKNLWRITTTTTEKKEKSFFWGKSNEKFSRNGRKVSESLSIHKFTVIYDRQNYARESINWKKLQIQFLWVCVCCWIYVTIPIRIATIWIFFFFLVAFFNVSGSRFSLNNWKNWIQTQGNSNGKWKMQLFVCGKVLSFIDFAL